MYIYESHLGGLYTSDEQIPYEDLYCEECGDSDMELGEAESISEAWDILKPDTGENGVGFLPAYILPILMEFADEDASLPDIPVNEYGLCTLSDQKIEDMLIRITGDKKALVPIDEEVDFI